MEEAEYESVLCVKPDVHVYRIPPRATNRGYRAAEWQLDQPSWSGRLRITAKGRVAYIKLEDRTSGELFAQAPVDQFPGTAVESVTDSSRYFVIRIEDGNGRRAFIGIGFGDRGDAFDFNVALQDHFKWVKQQCEFAKQAQNPDQGPKLDLSFKEGQTIKLNIALANCLLRENPGHVQWTGWDVNLCLAGRKLTFNEHQLCARLPWWSSGSESACHCGGYGFYQWSEKIPDSLEQLSLCTQLLSLCCGARAPQEENRHAERKPTDSREDPAQPKIKKSIPAHTSPPPDEGVDGSRHSGSPSPALFCRTEA
ncbi:adaptin ear-binding coat-associated protein 2 isoform X1 [Odocoileus virginianus]|uniref:Adaptin ear-binding coat-associated protein 2 isoform X1 n=1 Tax=Odocoileus virginianus TaxID=9874 RepID=A0ABM4HH10_ODOVR